MRKRIINKSDYPMVCDWSGYKNTHEKLPCKCDSCGIEVFRSINTIDKLIKDNGYKECYCVKCGTEKGMLKKYGVVNPFQVEEVKERCRQTKIKRYGNAGYVNPDKAKETTSNKIGVPHLKQINRSVEQIKVTSSATNLEEYLKSFTDLVKVKDITAKLGFTNSAVLWDKLKKWDLYKYIDSTATDYVYHTSAGEEELRAFIESLGFRTCRRRFPWGEIDIYVQEKNIGFEYNGCFWHNDLHKTKTYHYDKVTAAQEEGIRLIHIWDYEWLNNRQHIESYIRAQLGVISTKIYGRKCVVREVTKKECDTLLTYHQQHSTRAQVYLGLYYGDELVLCMLFSKVGKSIFTQTPVAQWEIRREVCREGYSVIGGKSKTFKYFVEHYHPQSVVSYVDRSKFTGNSYLKMGFVLDHINPARYDWVYKNSIKFRKRQPCIYREMKKLYDEGRVFRVYDSGRYCFIFTNVIT